MRFDEHFVRGVVPQVSFLATTFPQDVRFSIDTRTLQPGDIFVALKGAMVDGHEFIIDALRKGAAGIVMSQERLDLIKGIDAALYHHRVVICVPEVLDAFLALARAWRAQFAYPVIGVTGSVGKTTTKQLLSTIFTCAQLPHLVSQGNLNTKIGIALTMMRMRTEHAYAIFEVGINERGEMAKLAEFLRPTHAIITGIGHAHMQGLGTLVDIAAEKRDIFKHFTEESIGIINSDQPLLAEVGYRHPVVKFGTKTSNQVQARKVRVEGSTITFILKLYKKKYTITLHNAHMGMVYNVLAAAAAAYILHINQEVIVQAVQRPITVAGRFEHRSLRVGCGTLINDCYNANPESMKAALIAFQTLETQAYKVAILGDMLELGEHAPFWHRQIGRILRQTPSIQRVILVGSLVNWVKKTAPTDIAIDVVPSWQEALALLRAVQEAQMCVLVKGSNGMKLSNLVQEST